MVDEQKTLSKSSPRRGAARAMRVGAFVLACGLALILFPLWIDLRSLNKYVVALGLVGLLIGLGCMTNGAIDALRAEGPLMVPLDEPSRHTLLLAAVLFSILATGVALLCRRRRTAPLAMGGLVVVTVVALHLWYSRRQSTSVEPAQDPAPAVRSYIE